MLGQARVSWTFPRSHSIMHQWHCHTLHRSTAYHLGSRKWRQHQAWCHRHSLQSQFVQWRDSPRLTLTPGADIARVFDQSPRYSTACLAYPQHSLWTQYGVSVNTTTADNTGELARFLEDIMAITGDQELCLLHVDMEPLLYISVFHVWAWRYISPGCLWWAAGHQRREAPIVHHCQTQAVKLWEYLVLVTWRSCNFATLAYRS